MSIHPKAVVSSNASLGEGVSIGPYAILEDDVDAVVFIQRSDKRNLESRRVAVVLELSSQFIRPLGVRSRKQVR